MYCIFLFSNPCLIIKLILAEYQLKKPVDFKYLNQTGSTEIPGWDEKEMFDRVKVFTHHIYIILNITIN
jgi:hypothetical protein